MSDHAVKLVLDLLFHHDVRICAVAMEGVELQGPTKVLCKHTRDGQTVPRARDGPLERLLLQSRSHLRRKELVKIGLRGSRERKVPDLMECLLIVLVASHLIASLHAPYSYPYERFPHPGLKFEWPPWRDCQPQSQ